MNKFFGSLLLAFAIMGCCSTSNAETIGEVDTSFQAFGPNDKIVIEAFDDPVVQGVACHLSRAKTGGAKGFVGVATDPSRFSIACRQVGPITMGKFANGDLVFKESASILFKENTVARFYDQKRNVLIYVVYGTKLIGGSPQNSISTVPVQKW